MGVISNSELSFELKQRSSRIPLLIVEKNLGAPQVLCLANVLLSKADKEKSKLN